MASQSRVGLLPQRRAGLALGDTDRVVVAGPALDGHSVCFHRQPASRWVLIGFGHIEVPMAPTSCGYVLEQIETLTRAQVGR